MRKKQRQNIHYDELVGEVHRLVSLGHNLESAIGEALANPPAPLYTRLAPSPITLRRWFLREHPHYRRVDVAARALKLYRSGRSQAELAEHYGVTTRTIRNWLALAERPKRASEPLD